MTDRTPPHDVEAEQSTLGGMLLSRTAIDDVLGEVSAADFYLPKHELIFAAISAVSTRGEPVDAITITGELERRGELGRAGGAEYLHTLTTVVPTAANAGYYADIVRAKAVLRRLTEAGAKIAQSGFDAVGSPLDLVEAARAEVDRVAGGTRQSVLALGDGLDEFVADLQAAPEMTPTPWTDLNALIGGLRPGKLYVIGARPASGKTLVATQLAVELARTIGPVAFSSLEMSREEIRKRVVAQIGPVNLGHLVNNQLTDDDWRRMPAILDALKAIPLYVDATSGVGITQIQSHARTVARRGKLAGIVVDYLQLMRSPGRVENRATEVADFSRGLKILAQNMDVPVIALSQLNRSPEHRSDKRPSLGDLRESGAIEQDADVVMLLHREPDNPQTWDALKVIVAKNRHGEVGELDLAWQGHFARVTDAGTFDPNRYSVQPRRDLDDMEAF